MMIFFLLSHQASYRTMTYYYQAFDSPTSIDINRRQNEVPITYDLACLLACLHTLPGALE